jgi:hypothetical protein
MIRYTRVFVVAIGSAIAATTMLPRTHASGTAGSHLPSAGAVHARFDLQDPATGPFPADAFTAADHTHHTGRRLQLPYPDCTVRVSDCDDLDVVNTLDGFGLQPQLAISFDGPIDLGTVDSHAVFLINLGSTTDDGWRPGEVIGINQVVWDTFTHTLYVEADQLLEQHTRYALVATRRLRDTAGKAVEASEAFRRFRQTARGEYKQALLMALQAARWQGTIEADIVALSVFTTQSITPVMERIRDQIRAGTPEPANFLLGPGGERAAFNRADVAGIAWRRQTGVNPDTFAPPINLQLQLLQVVPGAVGTIAYGVYVSPDYTVHPGEYIPAAGTRTGTPARAGPFNRICVHPLPSQPVREAARGLAGRDRRPQRLRQPAPDLGHRGVDPRLARRSPRSASTTPGSGFGPLSTLTDQPGRRQLADHSGPRDAASIRTATASSATREGSLAARPSHLDHPGARQLPPGGRGPHAARPRHPGRRRCRRRRRVGPRPGPHLSTTASRPAPCSGRCSCRTRPGQSPRRC